MSTTPTGSLALAQDYLRASLAASATFRTWVGASGANANTQALARVHYDAFPEPANDGVYTIDEIEKYRPSVIVWSAPFAVYPDNEQLTDGSLGVRLMQDVERDTEDNPHEISVRLQNVIGGVLSDIKALSGTAGYLGFNKATLIEPWSRSDPDDVVGGGDVLTCELLIEWSGM